MSDAEPIVMMTAAELKEALASIPIDMTYEEGRESFPFGEWAQLGVQYIDALEHELQRLQRHLRASCRPIRMPPRK